MLLFGSAVQLQQMPHPTADEWAVAPSDRPLVATALPDRGVDTVVVDIIVAMAVAWAAAVAFSSFLRHGCSLVVAAERAEYCPYWYWQQ